LENLEDGWCDTVYLKLFRRQNEVKGSEIHYSNIVISDKETFLAVIFGMNFRTKQLEHYKFYADYIMPRTPTATIPLLIFRCCPMPDAPKALTLFNSSHYSALILPLFAWPALRMYYWAQLYNL
jgi:hypothetical protein